MAEDVFGLERCVVEGDLGKLVDQPRQGLVHAPAGIAFVEHVLELGVLLLYSFERVVQQAANAFELIVVGSAVFDLQHRIDRHLSVVLDEIPAGNRGDPEDVLLGVVVPSLQLLLDQIVRVVTQEVVIAGVLESNLQFGTPLLEGVGDVLQEDQPQNHMHVIAGVNVGTQAVSGIPQACVKILEELLFFVVHSNFPGVARSSAIKNAHPVGRTILFGGVGVRPKKANERSQPLSCCSRSCNTW